MHLSTIERVNLMICINSLGRIPVSCYIYNVMPAHINDYLQYFTVVLTRSIAQHNILLKVHTSKCLNLYISKNIKIAFWLESHIENAGFCFLKIVHKLSFYKKRQVTRKNTSIPASIIFYDKLHHYNMFNKNLVNFSS